MLTFSELAATAAIWGLTLTGCFFGIRAAIRRKKRSEAEPAKDRDNDRQ